MSSSDFDCLPGNTVRVDSLSPVKLRLLKQSSELLNSNSVQNADLSKIYDRRVVVYYIYCKGDQHVELVQQQVDKLVSSGVYDWCDTVYVFCTDESEKWVGVDEIFSGMRKVHLTKLETNRYEHPAILHVYNLAQKYDGVVLYMHTKGITAGRAAFKGDEVSNWKKQSNDFYRGLVEYFLIERYTDCLQAIDRGCNLVGIEDNPRYLVNIRNMRPAIDPICYMLPNFWWAKLSSLKDHPVGEPVITHDRYYYLRWITSLRDGRDIKYAGFFHTSWYNQLTYLPEKVYKDPEWLMSLDKDFKIERITCGYSTGVQIYPWSEKGPVMRDVTDDIMRLFFNEDNNILHIHSNFESVLARQNVIKKAPRRIADDCNCIIVITCTIDGRPYKITLRNHWIDNEVIIRIPQKRDE